MSSIQKTIYSIFQKIEHIKVSVHVWILSILSIIFFRGFLENFSNTTKGSIKFASLSSIFLDFPLFYLAGLLIFILIFYFLSDKSNKNIVKISKVFCFGLVLIWIAPITDLILTGGKGELIKYMKFDPGNPMNSLLFIFTKPRGISNGTRIEIIFILVSSSLYFYLVNKKIIRTFIYIFVNYLVIFSLYIAPNLILILSNYLKTGELSSISNPYYSDITSFKKILLAISQTSNFFTLDILRSYIFDTLASWISIINAFIAFNIWFFLYNKKKFVSFWKNARWERIVYYLIWISVGFLLTAKLNIYHWNWTLLNIINLTVLIISLISSWLLQVNINDIEDKNIDTISNQNRPLINKSLTISDLKIYNFFLLLIIIFSSITLGYEIFSLIVIWNCAYFIYSSPPLRLKQYPIISNLIIGSNGTIAIFIGIILSSGEIYYSKITNIFILTIILIISLISGVKDIKDIKGDKAENIKTIPVIFGEKRGKIIISIFVVLALILTSLSLGPSQLLIVSIIFGITAAYFINKQNYKEIYMFALFFIYILVLFVFNIF